MHGSDYECILRVRRGKRMKSTDLLEKIALNDSIILKWTLKEIVCEYICCFNWLSLRSSTKLNSVALVRERTTPTERPPPVGEVSANFCG
jgi:hypothetical protein